MQIGTYEVLRELGRGGMGAVYLARAVGPAGVQRLVAIKRPHEQRSPNPEVTERFLEEARITAQVHHANVVGMHQAGSDDDGYYLVFDYVEGESLGELIDRARAAGTRIPLPIVLRIVMDALTGLHAAHEARDPTGAPLGILHRDVSPQNLLVGRDGVTRLTDFGIAKSTATSVVTDQRYVRGKFVFMSPEYLQRLPVDRTLDVYAMGVTLWDAANGAPPWEGYEEAQLIQAILLDGVPPLTGVNEPLAALVATACGRDAGQRFQTARQMLDAIAALGPSASHLDVAEYVERVAGPSLDARREAIASAPPAAPTKKTPTQKTPVVSAPEPGATELHWQSEKLPSPAASPGDGTGTTDVRRVYEGKPPWHTLAYAGAGIAVLAAGVLVFTRGNSEPEREHVAAGSVSVSASAAPPLATATAQAVEPVVMPVLASDAGVARSVTPVRRPAHAARPKKPAKESDAYPPFSKNNPYK